MPKTPAPTLPELLKPFREAENTMAHTAVVLDEQRDLMRLCAAWTTMTVVWTPPRRSMPVAEAARWDWVWEGVLFEKEALADRAAVMSSVVMKRFEILRAARLVYPDATVSNVAKLIMRAAVAKASGARKKENG